MSVSMVAALLVRRIKTCKSFARVLRADRKILPGFNNNVCYGYGAAFGYCTCKTVVPFLLADIGEGIREVTIKEWHITVGDRIAEFDDVCEVESDKATVTITSRYAGSVRKMYYEVGDLAKVGDPLIDIELETDDIGDAAAKPKCEPIVADHESLVMTITAESERSVKISAAKTESSTRLPVTAVQDAHFNKVLTTPAVRRIATEKGIDLSTVRGTGKDGRVLKEDLLNFGDNIVSVTGYTKAMRHSMEVSHTIPTLVITDEVDLTGLTQVKTQLLPHAKITLLPFFIKATSLALSLHPFMNCTPNVDFTKLRLNTVHNIGVAIDTPLGLAVPNVKNVQTLSVIEISEQLQELRAKAGDNKLSPADVTGGTFTLSNMGAIAGSSFKPLIMPPEVALGALGRLKYRPRYNEKEELVRTPVINVSLAADHRILDGATVGRFLKDWKTYVENPALILANTKLSKF
ncbi:lipoamide acyltransferase component of branched-chain alpha-keto acid dehydrogenase complex, mitochondrial [Adelges cooleyi]|uniref:lipoamide acyltransferase component of branched-chain alpha-keto acid dehydrogenase complex, mitochondrial n=1 Tax=Adelges cooleyi TaxID=133065 RepID=UPI00217F688F|nr:lipoamide acyltransferase component of branched-chain alpha-keto acid dehydrogenase complex, mitochondrial [Adelges cooleyi]